MHKKDKVKEVIDKQIKKGKDFFELTPSVLITLKELKGFSERTLKRGRTEYKNEHKELKKGKSQSATTLKKKVFKLLDKTPNTTLKQLQEKFQGSNKKQLNDAFKLWKKEIKTSIGKKTIVKTKVIDTAGSLRQKVFVHLDKNPDLTLSKLDKVFPDDNKKTISNYLDQWRKEKSSRKSVISTKQRISDFLDKSPDAKLKDLKQAFKDINPSSIGAYHSQWKKNQPKPTSGAKKQKAAPKKQVQAAKEKSGKQEISVDSANQIIDALNNTINAQNKTIDILKAQNLELKDGQAFSFPELKGMTKKEIGKFERVMSTFLKGLRKA